MLGFDFGPGYDFGNSELTTGLGRFMPTQVLVPVRPAGSSRDTIALLK